MKKYIIERIEENFLICENFETKEIEKFDIILMPYGSKEGDFIKYDETNKEFVLDVKNTKKHRKRIKEKMDNVWD